MKNATISLDDTVHRNARDATPDWLIDAVQGKDADQAWPQ